MTTTTTYFLLNIFDRIGDANARNAEKDRIIDTLTEKLDAVLENQWQ